jgi:hypothetical protein
MVAALRLPDTAPRVRSLKALGHSASLAGLRREIGLSTSKYFDFSMASSELSTREQVLADALFASEIGTDAFVFGERAQPAQSAADRVPA